MTADAHLQNLITAAHRSQENIDRNADRHPLETLQFFGLKPDQTVMEVLPAKGWYSEILAPYLADQGRFRVVHFSPNGIEAYMAPVLAMFEERIFTEPEVFARTVVRHVNPPGEVELAPPASVDLALVFRNVHNWVWVGQEDDYFAAIFNALKPGGVLGIEQHRADPGTSLGKMKKTHYLTEVLVKTIADNAGFVFDASSEINANPKDTKDHPNSAWSLPPFLASGEVEKYQAIGESDRMTLRFVKPE